MARTFGWSLHEIEETDMVSLLEFFSYLPGKKEVAPKVPFPVETSAGRGKKAAQKSRRVYIDQVNFL